MEFKFALQLALTFVHSIAGTQQCFEWNVRIVIASTYRRRHLNVLQFLRTHIRGNFASSLVQQVQIYCFFFSRAKKNVKQDHFDWMNPLETHLHCIVASTQDDASIGTFSNHCHKREISFVRCPVPQPKIAANDGPIDSYVVAVNHTFHPIVHVLPAFQNKWPQMDSKMSYYSSHKPDLSQNHVSLPRTPFPVHFYRAPDTPHEWCNRPRAAPECLFDVRADIAPDECVHMCNRCWHKPILLLARVLVDLEHSDKSTDRIHDDRFHEYLQRNENEYYRNVCVARKQIRNHIRNHYLLTWIPLKSWRFVCTHSSIIT